jgi:hypothetical protein
MGALADRALADARAPPVDLPGPLSGVKDWSIVSSTPVRVRDALQDEFPGAGDYAALKGHTVLSVGGGAPVRDHFSPARAHDSRHLQSDASWQGGGLLSTACRKERLPELRIAENIEDTWSGRHA